MRNISEKSCRGNPNTHPIVNFFFFKLCLYEMIWKNIVELDMLSMTL